MAYNISAFAGAGAQFFDANGTPLAGGLLYVYTAGTTTPATTWTTNSGAVANTNPIVLDSAGRTPNEIWLNSGFLYKFVLKTSTGTLIGTYDNIPAIDDPTAFNNLITVTGTNTLIGTSVPPYTAYTAGMTLSFIPVNNNTGAVTIDVDGLGAKNIYVGASTPLSGGEIVAGRITNIEYDGTRFQLMTNALANNSVTAAKMANRGNELGLRNAFINGQFKVWQRGTTFTPAVGGVNYTADRWYYTATSVAPTTVAQQLYGAATLLKIVGATGNTKVVIGQRIEQVNAAYMHNSTVTISFTANNSLTSKTVTVYLKQPSTTSNDFSSVTTLGSATVSIGTSLNSYSVTITPTSSFYIYGLEVVFDFGALDTGNTLLFGVAQIELGSYATPVENRPYGFELALCQRYYNTGSFYVTVDTAPVQTFYPVEMRASPTIAGGGAGFTNITTGTPTKRLICSQTTPADQTLTFSAEL